MDTGEGYSEHVLEIKHWGQIDRGKLVHAMSMIGLYIDSASHSDHDGEHKMYFKKD